MTSQLQQDLERDQREAMYRSMTFIARRGGPKIMGDSKSALIAQRAAARRWLQAQADQLALAHAYTEFVETWSPVFDD